jgi:predicted negative regulator of RcsB-dependent stress response
MAYDLQEQEQLEELKAWWRQYGRLVIAALAAFTVGFAGFQGWRYYRANQAAAAVVLYEQLERAQRAGDRKKLREIAGELTLRYGSTPYAALAALVAARASFDSGDLAAAKAQLGWVLEHAREREVRDAARLRLAAVALDEKNYAEALRLLEEKPVEPMAGLYADLKGDVLVAQGKHAEARAAYQLALDRSDPASPYRAMLEMKLEALGESR